MTDYRLDLGSRGHRSSWVWRIIWRRNYLDLTGQPGKCDPVTIVDCPSCAMVERDAVDISAIGAVQVDQIQAVACRAKECMVA